MHLDYFWWFSIVFVVHVMWFRQVAAPLHASIPYKVIYGLSIAFYALVAKHQFYYLSESVMLARRFRQVAAFLQVLSRFLRSCLVRWMSVYVLSRLTGMLAKMVQAAATRAIFCLRW